MNAGAGSAGSGSNASSDPWACVARINESLEHELQHGTSSLAPTLCEAMRYAVVSGGKRLRPVLAWHACWACGVPGMQTLETGAAIEFVHAFSLVHDDLPSLDNDDLRRGQPTVHKRFGEALAILAGDALLNAAYGIMGRVEVWRRHDMSMFNELFLATKHMIEGQVLDTTHEPAFSAGAPEDKVRAIHTMKTGALITAACRLGVYCAASRSAQAQQVPNGRTLDSALTDITAYAKPLGLLFQITDDLLDATGTLEQTGKRTRKDAEAGKLTFPGVLGVEGAKAMVRELEAEAVEAANRFGNAGGRMLALIAHQMAERTA